MRNTSRVSVLLAGLLCASVCVCLAGPETPVAKRAPKAPLAPAPAMDAVTEGVQSTVQGLLRHGVRVDTNKARRAAIQAVATSVDPMSWLLTAEEATTIPEEGRAATNGVLLQSVAVIEKWPGGICYARFGGLYRGTGQETADDILSATNGGTTGMILDLRGAEGKGLDCVEAIAGLFLEDDREIFSVRNWSGTELERRRVGKARRLGIPAVFLVDEGTSAAAELLAAVVKSGIEVLLIGRTTRGDPLLREKMALPGGEVLYVGTRRVVPLTGDAYGPGGVKPDIVVAAVGVAGVPATNASPVAAKASGGGEQADVDKVAERTKSDPILQRAADILMGLRTLDLRALKL